MSELREPKPVRLIAGIIYKPDSRLDDCIESLGARFGEINFISDALPFKNTKYYEDEMGLDLERKIIAFEKLIRRQDIADAKIFTNKLEKVYSYGNKRTINIDPGYIAQEHLILATGKGYSHRPYIGKGVYADLTLLYVNDEFRPLEWTYPDYKTPEVRGLFKRLRQEYANQLKEEPDL
ncbi:MAG: DUF4416 family protein [Deltaproteobacteria bacterium]